MNAGAAAEAAGHAAGAAAKWERGGGGASANTAASAQTLRSLPTRYTFVVEGPEPPSVGSPRILPDSRIELSVGASPGARIRIQSSLDLQRWDNVAETAGTGITTPVLLPPSIQPQTFYRAVID